MESKQRTSYSINFLGFAIKPKSKKSGRPEVLGMRETEYKQMKL